MNTLRLLLGFSHTTVLENVWGWNGLPWNTLERCMHDFLFLYPHFLNYIVIWTDYQGLSNKSYCLTVKLHMANWAVRNTWPKKNINKSYLYMFEDRRQCNVFCVSLRLVCQVCGCLGVFSYLLTSGWLIMKSCAFINFVTWLV